MKLGKRSFVACVAAFLSVPAFAEEPKPVGQPQELGFAADRLDRLTNALDRKSVV